MKMSIRFPIETINGEKIWNLDDLMMKFNIEEFVLWNYLVKKTQIERNVALPGKIGDKVTVYGNIYHATIKGKHTFGINKVISDNMYFPNVHFNFLKLEEPKQWDSLEEGQLVCVSGTIGCYDDKNVKIDNNVIECRKLCLNNVILIKIYEPESEDL